MRYLTQALDIHGAEAGIEPASLSLKIKENFKFENFSISMRTLIGLFQWYDWNAVRHRVDEKYPGCFSRSSWNSIELCSAIIGTGNVRTRCRSYKLKRLKLTSNPSDIAFSA
jgi:hypothetical protein